MGFAGQLSFFRPQELLGGSEGLLDRLPNSQVLNEYL